MSRRSRDPEDFDDKDVPPVKISLQTLREAGKLAGYLWPYRGRFVLAVICLAVGSTLALAFPRVTGLLIDALNLPPSQAPQSWWSSIDGVAVGLIVILGLQAVFAFGQSYWFMTVGERSLADLRRDTYARLIRLPMVFHTQRRVGELASRLAADLTQIQDTLVMAIPHLLRQTAILVGGVVLIAMTSGRLTLIMLSSLPLLILIAVIFGRSIRRASRVAQDRLAESNVIVQETLQGIASVKAFTNERHEEDRYRKSLDQFIQAVLRGAWARGAFVSFIVFALFGAIVLVLWCGARQVRAGELHGRRTDAVHAVHAVRRRRHGVFCRALQPGAAYPRGHPPCPGVA